MTTYPPGRYRFDGATRRWHSGPYTGPYVPPVVTTAAIMLGGSLTTLGAPIVQPPTDAFIYGTTKPTADNTGLPAGTQLTTYNGDLIVTTAGAVIERMYVIGRIIVRAANVTIRNCEVVGAGYAAGDTALVDCNNPNVRSCLIEFNYLHQLPSTGNAKHNAIIGHDYTAQRNSTAATVDGFGVYNNNAGFQTGPTNVTIRGNYVKDLAYFSPDSSHSDNRTHNDGVQIQGGTGTVIYGNTINAVVSTTVGTAGAGPASDPYVPNVTGHAITCTPVVSAISGVSCTYNWIHGGFGNIIVVSNQGTYPSNAGNFDNNRVSGASGPTGSQPTHTAIEADNNMTGTTFVGNVDEDTGAPVAVSYHAPGSI